nr:hypothetical protein [uncultured Nitrososphaera sp.]
MSSDIMAQAEAQLARPGVTGVGFDGVHVIAYVETTNVQVPSSINIDGTTYIVIKKVTDKIGLLR